MPLAKYMELKRELREHKQRLMEKEEREKRDDLKKKLAGSKLDDDTKTLLAGGARRFCHGIRARKIC